MKVAAEPELAAVENLKHQTPEKVFFLFMRLFPILFFISIVCFGQKKTPEEKIKDSIFFYLESSSNELENAKKAIFLSKKIDNDTLELEGLIKQGLKYYSKKDTSGLKTTCIQLKVLYSQKNNLYTLAKEQHFRALFFRVQFKYDSSYYYYHESKNTYKEIGDSLEVGKRLLSMGYMQNDEKDYLGAQSTIIEALRYLEPLDEIINTGDCYNVLGNALANAGEYEEARENYEKSRKIFSKSLDKRFKTGWDLYLINNIGYTYLLDKNYNEAQKYFKEGLKKGDIANEYPNHYQILLANYSDCLYEFGKKKEALKNYYKILKLREDNKNVYGQSLSHNSISNYFQKEGNKKSALFHAKKAYDLSKKISNNFIHLAALTKLVDLTNGVESKQYFNEYVLLNDSLNNRERYFKNQFAKVRFETEKKEKENVTLKLDNSQKQAQLEKEKQQKLIGWLASGLAILGLGFSYVYFRARRKKLMYEAQLQKASVREEERQQIAKSLHDEVAGDLRMLHQKLTKTELQKEADNLEKIKENVRNLSHQLSSVSFDEVSFKDQIVNLIADSFSPSFRISTEGINDIDWKEINNTLKRTLYLCIRESLQNTLKYAEASKFFIHFSIEKKEIVLLLNDNGKGFDLTKGKKGIGLKNLKERVEEIHGSFDIESSEEGTKTTIRIPIHGR